MFHNPLADGIVVLVLILLFVGPKRLPMLSRSIGESIKEFKGGVSEHHDKAHLDAAPSSTSTTSAPVTQTHGADAPEKRETVS